ncbi:hypothetical protein C7964_1045 [Loktanella sp. PT4BL]|nr:hypothetical protein C7964_1045 [Loktanella sp. PT4BL]
MLSGINTRTNKHSGLSSLCGVKVVKFFIDGAQTLVTACLQLWFACCLVPSFNSTPCNASGEINVSPICAIASRKCLISSDQDCRVTTQVKKALGLSIKRRVVEAGTLNNNIVPRP